ncbi:MAG: ABC transporter permease, partial [Acidobacteria bacterium]|nr:ABC transporter permease [Acidobacteriota bacterium]
MSQASDMRRRVSLVLILAAVGIIAGYVLRGDGETPAIFGRRPAGYAQLVSIQPLPLMDEVMDGMDGVMCEWAPASSSTPLMASLLQERQSGGAAAQSADPDRRAEAAQRDPVRVIRDSYALYSAVAVDPIRNEVVLTDENLFNIMVYDRLDNTPPSAAMSEPKRMIGGLKTKIEFQCGLYIDPASGDIVYAPDLGEGAKFHGKALGDGRLNMSVRWDHYTKQIVVFPCISRMLFSLVDPVHLFMPPSVKVKIIDSSGRPPRQFGYLFGFQSASCVVFAPREGLGEDGRLKILVGGELLINSPGGADEKEARGSGYDLQRDALVPTSFLAVRDMWRLNEARLQTMRRHAIENQKLDRLHEAGRSLIERASKAMTEKRWSEYVALIRAAGGVTRRAYPDVVGTLNDVMQGMIFFLALVIPAAFFGERLLFASADIRRQLAGFGLLLLVIWIVISQIHPAFDIAHPLVILLAFAIMAMAVFVLFMISGRFNRYMREYHARQAQVHETDISRVGAAYTAFTLGISNMRRRKLRSGLTLLTLTLLTFTVLSFTSFKPDIRFLVFPLPHDGDYEGVLIRNRGWNRLGENTLDFARSHFQTGGVLSPRNWYIAADDEERKYVEVRRGDLTVRSTGLLGLSPQEREITGVDRSLSSGTFFASSDESSCLLSQEMAVSLGIAADEVGRAEVQIFGRSFVVRGIFDAAALEEVRDLDHEPLTPVDFMMSAAPALGPSESVGMAVTDPVFEFSLRPFVHLEPDNVLILPYETLREAGGTLRSVAVKFSEGADPRDLVED